ncbi:MAG TPA: MBL fold metallo-hydrolase [Bryobacteraceae bacterium]|nr:MBL fold metallo-hydrolase [Bryobacteraceae bacterium]
MKSNCFCYKVERKGRGFIVKICILASSSSGNAAFLSTERTRLLIDAGIGRRELAKRLAAIGEDLAQIDAVLVTHEHSDHVAGLAALARFCFARRARHLAVFATERTAPYLEWGECVPAVETFQAGCGFTIGDFDISSFTIPHDAVDPVGYTVRAEGIKVAIATDLGYIPDSLRVHFRDTDVLMLESNHDLEMLRVGPYPWSVKQRVMSRRGHLSNEVTAEFIRNDLDSRVSTLILGHLSEHNNHPELVRRAGYDALDGRALFTQLFVAEPGTQSPVFSY